MSLKCRKIFPAENIMISFNPDDLTGSIKFSTNLHSFSRSDQKTKSIIKSQSHDLQQLTDNQNLAVNKNRYPTNKEDYDVNSVTLHPRRTQHLPQCVISACQTACDINYNYKKLTC
jgi:hypothetical protein